MDEFMKRIKQLLFFPTDPCGWCDNCEKEYKYRHVYFLLCLIGVALTAWAAYSRYQEHRYVSMIIFVLLTWLVSAILRSQRTFTKVMHRKLYPPKRPSIPIEPSKWDL